MTIPLRKTAFHQAIIGFFEAPRCRWRGDRTPSNRPRLGVREGVAAGRCRAHRRHRYPIRTPAQKCSQNPVKRKIQVLLYQDLVRGAKCPPGRPDQQSRSPPGKNSRYLLANRQAGTLATRRFLCFSTRPLRKPRKYLANSGTALRDSPIEAADRDHLRNTCSQGCHRPRLKKRLAPLHTSSAPREVVYA